MSIVWTPTDHLLHYCSDQIQLLRYTAWFKRFFQYLRDKRSTPRGHLTSHELNEAKHSWISVIQQQNFHTEMAIIRSNSSKTTQMRLWNLNPFLDETNLLRVGGRLSFADINYDEKHPFILPKNNHFSNLLILHSHDHTLHGGTQLTLSNLRQNYWILGGRNEVRKIIKNCFTCARVKGAIATQLMADLPEHRVSILSRPFLQTGMDLCGPITLRLSKSPGSKIYKGYVVLFVCMSVKAVHLEPVTDLTSEAFLMSLQRFISHHGKPTDLYSDCGTNFVGAERLLRKHQTEFLESIYSNVIVYLTNEGINFHFNPPHAPSFGGIWESNIRRVKHHLYRVIGDKALAYDELATILARIQAILNSRPLVPMSDDPTDTTYITPGHFLIGEAFTTTPEPHIIGKPEPITHHYRSMLKRVQIFAAFFKNHYFHTLQQRPKWLKKRENLKIGDLVLIKEQLLPPLKWAMGRITKTMPGKDGLVRVCQIKTENGSFVRPISKLAPLPVEEHTTIDNTLTHHQQIMDNQHAASTSNQLIMLPLFLSPDNDSTIQSTDDTNQPFNIIIEGNIGAGKSTLLQYFKQFPETKILTFREPVEQWSNFHGVNLLDLMYTDRSTWAFSFQLFALLTMLKTHQISTEHKIKIMERSFYSSKIFTKANAILNAINPIQCEILNHWYDFIEKEFPIHVDLIIYLQTTPEMLMDRIKTRNRPEEQGMELSYLKMIHELHEDCFIRGTEFLPAPISIIDGNQSPTDVIQQLKLLNIPGLGRMNET